MPTSAKIISASAANSGTITANEYIFTGVDGSSHGGTLANVVPNLAVAKSQR